MKIKHLMKESLDDDDFKYFDPSEFDIKTKDDDEDGDDFKEPMADQLGKILDSSSSQNPVDTVRTADGKEFKVSPEQARTIRMLMTTDKVKPQVKAQFIKDIHYANTLQDFLDYDYHELPSLFVKRYLG